MFSDGKVCGLVKWVNEVVFAAWEREKNLQWDDTLRFSGSRWLCTSVVARSLGWAVLAAVGFLVQLSPDCYI